MTSEEFAATIFDGFKKDLSWIDRVKTTHSQIIERGLSMKFKDAERQIDASSSLGDAILLYLLIRHYNCRSVLEIGTWFGAGAGVMALAVKDNGGGRVFTCDGNNCYVNDTPTSDVVTYFNHDSKDVLRYLKKNGVKIDFCFVDGRLRNTDAKEIVSMYGGKFVYTNHDYGLEKCKANIKLIEKTGIVKEKYFPRIPWYANSGYREEYTKVEVDPFKITSNTVILL